MSDDSFFVVMVNEALTLLSAWANVVGPKHDFIIVDVLDTDI